MWVKKNISLLLTLVIVSIAGCGGGQSGSGGGVSLAKQREAVDCVSINDRTISNACGFAVVVRIFAGAQTPITVAGNSAAQINDDNVTGQIIFGACEAPFTPVRNKDGFDCL